MKPQPFLAGDALQALPLSNWPVISIRATRSRLCVWTAKAAGRSALVGGQEDDLAAEGRFAFVLRRNCRAKAAVLAEIHERKTGAMITSSVKLGGLAVGATVNQLAALETYGQGSGWPSKLLMIYWT